MNTPAIGELRDEIILEQQNRTPTTGGGAVLSWQPLGPLWAKIRPLSGRETVIADRIVSHVSHEIYIWHRAGTTAAMRFRLGDRQFDILAVLPTGSRGQWMRCLCRERAE
jgi:SPP1 family predicted phage head-tail adaptor